MIKYIKSYEGLHEIPVYINDEKINSEYFALSSFPDILTGGKNTFLITGTDKLVPDSLVKIEVLDSQNNVIYSEVPNYLENGISQDISIFVYDDTLPGLATITIIGELIDVPNDWKGVYNVKWERQVVVNPYMRNQSLIKFYKEPSMYITESIKSYLDSDTITIPGSKIEFASGTINGKIAGDYVYDKYYITLNSDATNNINIPGSFFENDILINFDTSLTEWIGTDWKLLRNNPYGSTAEINGSFNISLTNSEFTEFNWIIIESVNPITIDNSNNIYDYELNVDHFIEGTNNSVVILIVYDGSKSESIMTGNGIEMDQSSIILATPIEFNKTSYIFRTNKSSIKIGVLFFNYLNDAANFNIFLKSFKLYKTEHFIADMIGGTVYVKMSDTIEVNNNEYIANIINVINGKTLIVDKPYVKQSIDVKLLYVGDTQTDKSIAGLIPSDFSSKSYIISYKEKPKQLIQDNIHYKSFADIYLKDISVLSGDLSKIKVFTKSSNQNDYSFLGDYNLESKELLFNNSNGSYIGTFYDKSIFDSNWSIDSGSNPSPLISHDSNKLQDSIGILNGKGVYTITQKSDFYLDKECVYKFKGTFLKLNDIDTSYLKVYLFTSPNNILTEISTVNASNSVVTISEDIISKIDGVGKIIIETSGDGWYISELSFKISQETNFSPSSAHFNIPINVDKRNEYLSFKVEFYDSFDRKSDIILQTDPCKFLGSNLVVEGEDNLITGSLYMGKTLSSGVEFSGKNSAYIRSVGYEGFNEASEYDKPGFVMYSGSILPNSSNNYGGVGLELHAGGNKGSLRFKANGSESFLEVSGTIVATAGNIGGWEIYQNYILSTHGNMMLSSSGVISSSNFYVSEQGNITASNATLSGTVYATDGQIGNWNIINGMLSGSKLTLNANSSSIYKTDNESNYYINFNDSPNQYYVKFGDSFMIGTDGKTHISGNVDLTGTISASLGNIGGWLIQSESLVSSNDKMKLISSGVISSSNFYVSEQGNITASNASFNGSIFVSGTITGANIITDTGTVSGWSLEPNKFMSVNGNMMLSASGVISSSNFYVSEQGNITASNATLSGTVYATGGQIGNWTITNGRISGSNITFDADNSRIYKTDDENGYYLDFTPTELTPNNYYVRFGPNFAVSSSGMLIASGAIIEGTMTASAGYIGGWQINSNSLTNYINGGQWIGMFSSGSYTFVAGASSLDFSTAKFSVSKEGRLKSVSGTIANWEISDSIISSSYIKMDSANNIISIGGSTFGATGIQLDGNSNDPRFFAGNTNNFLKYTSNGVEIKTENISISSSGLIISSSTADGGNIMATRGTIGGWSLSNSYISSSNLILNANGSIYSSNFISGLSGWIITSELNGYAEFENAKIRGTLRTVTFEKDTISCIGGETWISNATTLSGSVLANSTVFNVENASGFTNNEILILKRFNDTGFSTEYVCVIDTSITNQNTGAGSLTVIRGYGNELTHSTSSLIGFDSSTSSSYESGQTIVSTGLIGSGFIKMNANPRDAYTPYIDVIERTGSAIYDLQLKSRIGDLSGLSSNMTYGYSGSRYGIYAIDAYIQGSIHAITGSFQGIVHAGEFKFGKNVNGSHNGIYLNTNNFWYDDSNYKFGGSTSYISGSNLAISISTSDFKLTGNNLLISSSGEISSSQFKIDTNGSASFRGTLYIGNGTFWDYTSSLNSSITESLNLLSGSLSGSLGNLSGSLENLSGSLNNISSSIINTIVTNASGSIIKPQIMGSAPTGLYLTQQYLGFYSGSYGWNSYISSSGAFLFKKDNNNLISFDNNTFYLKSENAVLSGSNVSIIAPNFGFYGNNLIISSSGEISSSQFRIDTNGNATFKGTVYIGSITQQEYINNATSSLSGSIENLSGSLNLLSGSLSGSIENLSGSLNNISSSIINTIVTNASGSIIKPQIMGSAPTGLYLTQQYLGFYSGSYGWNSYISSSGAFLFKKDNNNLISFDNNTFYLKSENAVLSGSNVSIVTSNFFLGNASNYISGSSDSFLLSSNNFKLNSTNLLISSSGEISASYFRLDTQGQIFASKGNIADWTIDSSSIYKNEGLNGVGFSTDDTIRIYAGSNKESKQSAPFKVNKYGKANIQGGIIDGESLVPEYKLTANGTPYTSSFYIETFSKLNAVSDVYMVSSSNSMYIDTDFGRWNLTANGSGIKSPFGKVIHYSENPADTKGFIKKYDGAVSVYQWPNTYDDWITAGNKNYKKVIESSFMTFSGTEFPKITTTDISGSIISSQYVSPNIEIGFNARIISIASGVYNTSVRTVVCKYNASGDFISGSRIESDIISVLSVGQNWFVSKINVPSYYLDSLSIDNQSVKFSVETCAFSGNPMSMIIPVTDIPDDCVPRVTIREFFIKRPMILKDISIESLNINGGLVVNGDLTVNGNETVTFVQTANGDILPDADNIRSIGNSVLRFNSVYTGDLIAGGICEVGLRTNGLKNEPTGTVLVWKDGHAIPCFKNEDQMVVGIVKNGKDEPIILGAEPMLVTGKVRIGDLLCTSSKKGHGKSINRYLFINKLFKRNITGKVIGQALENADGESSIIKAYISKM